MVNTKKNPFNHKEWWFIALKTKALPTARKHKNVIIRCVIESVKTPEPVLSL